MSDLTATNCGGGCSTNGGNNSWLLIILLLCCCNGGNGGFGGFGNGCGDDNGCILIILVLLCCCGNGFQFNLKNEKAASGSLFILCLFIIKTGHTFLIYLIYSISFYNQF